MLIVPSVSVEFMTLISELDAPNGVDSAAMSDPFCEMLKLFIISPIERPKPNGSSENAIKKLSVISFYRDSRS